MSNPAGGMGAGLWSEGLRRLFMPHWIDSPLLVKALSPTGSSSPAHSLLPARLCVGLLCFGSFLRAESSLQALRFFVLPPAASALLGCDPSGRLGGSGFVSLSRELLPTGTSLHRFFSLRCPSLVLVSTQLVLVRRFDRRKPNEASPMTAYGAVNVMLGSCSRSPCHRRHEAKDM